MAQRKKKQPGPGRGGKREGAGRPKRHSDGFLRTTLIAPPDLISSVDVLCASLTRHSGRIMKRAELLRAAAKAIIEAHDDGDLDLTGCLTEEQVYQVIRERLRG
ncbi:hypothetical protein ACFL59_06425 [Planctomycetota bacterium]